uniref:Gamma-glutamyl peptidase 3-like n=1 Tax=Nicotiana tabacum TaxID=4097 RepID=A0A1S3Y6R9_TOBAC
VLCRALGGDVRKADSGWDIGIREVSILKESLTYNTFLDDLNETPSTLSIIECHQDEVWEVPKEAKVMACSDKTRVEMFTIGDHILGIQGHPEYTKDILNNLIDRLLNFTLVQRGFAEDARSELHKAEPDRK